MSKVILITGASIGFGKIWVESFLKCVDRVVATGISLEPLKHLEKQ